MLFKDLTLHPSIHRALTDQGYTSATPIQQKAIPVVLAKSDIMGCAQTGTGKTAAFVVPLIQLMLEQTGEQTQSQSHRQLRTLILAPTRELAMQISESVHALSRYTGLRYAVVFGGVSQHSQVQKIRNGIDILVATPGRLKDLMQQGFISLKNVEYLVLDEADRMLDMGFVHEVKQIIARMPTKRQTLLFSATMPSAILQLANSLLNNPVKVEVAAVSSTAEKVEQFVYYTDKMHKPALLCQILEKDSIESVIVFTQMKHMADKVTRFLNQSGIAAEAIHGNKSQRQREQALDRFKKRHIRVLVATDIAARGIDIERLSHVINYELPVTAETYVHRIGRTGRAGMEGIAFSFCSPEERPLLRDIHKLIKRPISATTINAMGIPMNNPILENEPARPLASMRRKPMRNRNWQQR